MKTITFDKLKELNKLGYKIIPATLYQTIPAKKHIYQLVDNKGNPVRPYAIYYPNSNNPLISNKLREEM